MQKHLTNLKHKIGHYLEDDIFEEMCSKAQVVKLKKGECLNDLKPDRSGYFISQGSLIKKVITTEGKERTVMFHTTNFYFFTGFYDTFLSGKTSIFNIYAQENTILLKFKYSDIEYWRKTSTSFLRFNVNYIEEFHVAIQILRAKNITLTPKKYLKWLFENYPDFFKTFSSKAIASFMGISPVHFSNLKKELFS